MMPTELFCARARELLLPGRRPRRAQARRSTCPAARRRVRAERAGRELRYGRLLVACAADVDGRGARHADRTRPAVLLGVQHAGRRGRGGVWSPSLKATLVPDRKHSAPWPSRTPTSSPWSSTAPITSDPSSPATPTGCARGSTSSPRTSRASRTPPTRRCSPRSSPSTPGTCCSSASARAANGTDPDAYVCPDEGEAIYVRIPELSGADELVGYALGSLDHFAELLTVYRAAADGDDAEAIDRVRADVDRARAELRDRARRRRRGDSPPRPTSSTASASWPRSRATSMPSEAAPPDLRRPAAAAARLDPARVALRDARAASPRRRAR